jgi:hypothetical protein
MTMLRVIDIKPGMSTHRLKSPWLLAADLVGAHPVGDDLLWRGLAKSFVIVGKPQLGAAYDPGGGV